MNVFKHDCNGGPHDKNEPGKDKVSYSDSIPQRMVKEPVATSSIIHENH